MVNAESLVIERGRCVVCNVILIKRKELQGLAGQ